MLVILGIVILVISFIVALISLVKEEKKRERMIAETDAPPVKQASKEELLKQVVKGIEIPKAEPKPKPVEEIPAEPATPRQEAVSTEYVPFPWETGKEDEKVPEPVGVETKEEPKDEVAAIPQAPKLDPSKGRFPPITQSQEPLAGSFKINDIAKDEN